MLAERHEAKSLKQKEREWSFDSTRSQSLPVSLAHSNTHKFTSRSNTQRE